MQNDDLERAMVRLENVVNTLAQRVSEEPQWYSVSNVATLTKLSTTHIRRSIEAGILPASNLGTVERACYRVSREDLTKWMESRKAGAAVIKKLAASPKQPTIPYSPFVPASRPQPSAE